MTMAFSFFKRGSGSDDRLDRIEATIQQMLADDRETFDMAMSALMGDVEPKAVRKQIKATDKRVNEGERSVRRELVVHASVVGSLDSPALFVYMSIVKDIERIGDYAKNLLDLSRDGAVLGEHDDWRPRWHEAAEMITATAAAFADRDVDHAKTLLSQGDVLLSRYDDEVSELVKHGHGEPEAVARALALRYLKRIIAHLTNVLSSIVMPLDRIDYFDEDPEDREP